MKSLITHSFEHNLKFMLQHSYRHCHVQGLHSIVLRQDDKGHLIRLFYADKHHTLHCNNPEGLGLQPMSLGIHNHAKDLYFNVLCGQLTNIIATESLDEGIIYGRYRFDSKINGGTGGFYDQTLAKITFEDFNTYDKEDGIFKMTSDQMHTVFVEHKQQCVWSIIEADPSVEQTEKYTFSNHDLTKLPPEQSQILYQRFKDSDELRKMINEILELI